MHSYRVAGKSVEDANDEEEFEKDRKPKGSNSAMAD